MKYSDKDSHIKLRLLYSDNHLCVVIKPPGMVVPIENDPENSLEYLVKLHFQKELGKKVVFLQPIHRLDKPVGGLVVFARSSKALSRMNEAQRNKDYQKFYLVKVCGAVKKERDVLVHQLIHDEYFAKVVKKGGKEAILTYRRVYSKPQESLLVVQLHSGRYHQIRAQLSAIGHPIIGDSKYGAPKLGQNKMILLYHTKMIITHPVTKKKMMFKVRPDYF